MKRKKQARPSQAAPPVYPSPQWEQREGNFPFYPSEEQAYQPVQPTIPPAPPSKKKKGSSAGRFIRNLFPWKGDSFGQVFWKLFFLAALLVFVAAATYLISYYVESYQSRQFHSGLSDMLLEDTSPDALEEIERDYNITLPAGINAKLAKLYAENPDTIGWLNIPNTNISHVVVQGNSNSQYLRHDFYGKYATHGTVFADYQASIHPMGQNVVLYGHNMRDGSMFAELKKYRTLDGYRASPVITLDLLSGTKQYKVFSVFLTNASPEENNGQVFYYRIPDFSKEGDFTEFCRQLQLRSLLNTTVDVQPGDRLLTLSTCAYDFNDGRLVVVARELRDGENAAVDTAGASYADSPLYPQVWYDKKGTANPYKGEKVWAPSDFSSAGDAFSTE